MTYSSNSMLLLREPIFHEYIMFQDPFYYLGLTSKICLTHCGLVTPYGDRYLGQHWLKYWLVAWWHQIITWTYTN